MLQDEDEYDQDSDDTDFLLVAPPTTTATTPTSRSVTTQSIDKTQFVISEYLYTDFISMKRLIMENNKVRVYKI